MPDLLQLDDKRLKQLDGNIKQMVSSGASQDDVMKYALDFKNQFGVKKKDGGEISSPTELPSVSREYLDKGQELADASFLKKIGEPDRSQLVSQYKSPDISLTQKPKKDYYSTKLEKGLIFDKEGQLYAPSSEALSKNITAAEQSSLKKSTQKDLVEKSREMPVVVEPTEPTEEQGLLLNLVSSLDRGFAKNFISNPMKGLGTFLQGTTKKVLGGSGEGDLSNALIKYGDYLNNAIDELTPQDEEFKNSLWDQAAQALGQVGSLILTGGLTGASGKAAALVAQAPKGAAATAASRIASQLSAPTSISAGLSMGQAEFDRAIQAGATDDQAFEVFYKNAVTGSVLETIPVMQFFKRFNKATAGGFVNYLKTKGVAGFTGGVEEMTTEILQQLYANKTAKDIYNINQSILDGVGSSGGVGFGVGFLLNAMGANARILRKQGKTQDAIAIENQIEQYEDNLKNPKVTSGNTAKDIVTQGVEIGTQKAVQDLDRDLANNVITPEKYQEEIAFAEKAAQVADKIPETVTGESRVKSVELLVERNDIKQANQNLLQQKQTTDEAYHAGIDEEIKANEEKIKEIDAKVYDIAKKPSKEFGDKKYIVNGEEVSQEAFEALQGKPIGTKTIVEPTEIGGLKVIKRVEDAGGEAVYEVEGERFLTADGKELAVAKVKIPKEEAKPEVKVEDIIGEDVETNYNERKKLIEDKLNKQLEDNKDILDDINDKGGTRTVRQKIYQEHTNEIVELEKWKMKDDLKKEDTPDGRIKNNNEFSVNQLTDAIPNSEVNYENKEDSGVTTITLSDKNTKKHIASIDIGTGDTIDGYAGVRVQVNGEHQGKGLSKHLYNLALTEAKKQGLKGLYTIDEMLKTPDKTIATRDNFVTRKNTDEKLKTQARRKFTNIADPNITFIENVSDKFINKGATKLKDKIPETVTGESRVKSVELLVERNDIKQANQNLLQQKQASDEAYHAGIDEEIKANEEKIKKIDSEVYDITKKPSKEFGDKKYIVNGEEVSQEAFEALTGKPIGTKEIITAEVKPVEELSPEADIEKRRQEEFIKRAKKVSKSAKNIIESVENGKSQVFTNVLDAAKDVLSNLQAPIGGNKSYFEYLQKQVNAEFDAELAALKEVKPTEGISEIEKRQKQLEGVERINPNAGFPIFNVGQKYNDGNKYLVQNSTDKRTSSETEGFTVISKIIEPAEVDNNGKMTKVAVIETTTFDSKEDAQKALQDNYNKYKTIAEERLAKAQAEVKPTEEIDIYDHQDKNAEIIVSDSKWKGQVWRYKFENAGDILRELAKYKNEFLDPGYIYEKVDKIREWLDKQKEKQIHIDDSYGALKEKDSELLNKLKNSYKNQPVLTEAQQKAKDLVLNLIDGNLSAAENQVKYFEQFKGDDVRDKLKEANLYPEQKQKVKPTEVETKITNIQKNLDLANKIEKARSGDKKAQEELTKFGIKYDKNPIYRHVSESEVNALNNGEQIEGKFKNGRVDVTTNSKPSTGANAEYRITFNDTYDFNKGDKAKVKNEELGDGWIAEGGYNKGDVLRIEKRNEDGSYTSVYEGKNKTVEGELNKQLSDLQGDKTQEVNIVKLTDLPDRAFAVGMTVEKFEDLKYKIQKEGFIQPIIIDKESGNVLDGQNRLFVAQDLGIKNVPSIYMDNPTREDLNEKIKELEKQYIPSQEVKPIEENKLKQYNRKGTITPDVINLKYDDNGKEVGGMTLGKYKNYLTLDHIYFSPEYRGTGLSKYAYKDALEIAKNQGYEGLMVGGQLTTEYKTKETYKNFATKELDIKNEKGNPYILLTDWIGKENIEETPEIRLMSPEKVKTTLYHGTDNLLQGDIKMSREGIKMSSERLASGSSKEGWGFYTTPNVQYSEVIPRELNPNMKDFPAGNGEPAVKYSSFGGISPDKGFIYEIKLDPSAKVAYDNGLVKDFRNIKKQEFEKLRSLGIDAIYSIGEYVILNPSKIISNKIVLKNTGKKLVNVIPMGERGKLEMNKYKAVTPENLNSYLESILGKGYKKGDIFIAGDKKGMTLYYNPTTDESAAVQTGVSPNWEKVEEVKPAKTYQEALKEKQAAEKKQTRRTAGEKAAITKEVYRKVNMMDDPRDAEEAALRYLAEGGKIRDEDINDVYGRVKRAELNTGRREFKSAEVKSKDFAGGKEKISDIAHRIWEDSGQQISEKEAEEALMAEIGNNNTRLEAAEAYLEKYSPEYLEEKTYQRQAEESEAQILEAEQKVAETNKKIKEEFKEVVGKASKKAKENAKKDFVDRNFEYLKQKIKIEEKCPF